MSDLIKTASESLDGVDTSSIRVGQSSSGSSISSQSANAGRNFNTMLERLSWEVYNNKKTLQEASAEIDGSRNALKADLEQQKAQKIAAYEEATIDLRVASAQGDRSENAEYTAATEALQKLRMALGNIEAQLKSMESKDDECEYVPIGMIVMYTTFLLKDNKGEVFVFKMYPDNVSDIDGCMIAKNGNLGTALWLKQPGDVVSVTHNITGKEFKYEILGVY